MLDLDFLADLGGIRAVRAYIPSSLDEHLVDEFSASGLLVKLKDVRRLIRLGEDRLHLLFVFLGGLGPFPCCIEVGEKLLHLGFLLGQFSHGLFAQAGLGGGDFRFGSRLLRTEARQRSSPRAP